MAEDPRRGPPLSHAEVDAALRAGARLFDAGRFWDAHEAWEAGWHRAPSEERDLFQGLIHAAAACLHHLRGNPEGHAKQVEKMERRFSAYPDAHRGIDLAALRQAVRDLPSVGEPCAYPVLRLGPAR